MTKIKKITIDDVLAQKKLKKANVNGILDCLKK